MQEHWKESSQGVQVARGPQGALGQGGGLNVLGEIAVVFIVVTSSLLEVVKLEWGVVDIVISVELANISSPPSWPPACVRGTPGLWLVGAGGGACA